MSTAPSSGSELRIGERGLANSQAARVAVIARKAKSGMSFFTGVLRKIDRVSALTGILEMHPACWAETVTEGNRSVSNALRLQLSQLARELF